jgi:hypothetical protein
MFHGGVAGAAATTVSSSSPAGQWSRLVSYYSAELEDWMLVAEANPKASLWITQHGYVKQREEGVWVANSATVAAGYTQAMVQYWKAVINDTTLAGSDAVVAELEKQGYVRLWDEGYGEAAADPTPPSPPPSPGPHPHPHPHPHPPPPPPPPKPAAKYFCFGGPPGPGVCAKTSWPNATKYVNDSSCASSCPPAPTPPVPPHAYEIPAQQFGFTAVQSMVTDQHRRDGVVGEVGGGAVLSGGGGGTDGAAKTTYLFIGIRFGSAPTKNHDFQYWEPLRFDPAGNILPLQWADNFTIAV